MGYYGFFKVESIGTIFGLIIRMVHESESKQEHLINRVLKKFAR